MQPLRRLMQGLELLADADNCLFTPHDLRALVPDLSDVAFKTLLSRAAKAGYLESLCRGLYLYKRAFVNCGLILFHAAAKLRADEFNYLSLETVLSDAGVISQIPINRIFVMSSGRSNVISCAAWGTIEFIHTRQTPQKLVRHLVYDTQCRLWRADVEQALHDMRATRRSTSDLIDWSVVDELIRERVG